MYELSGMTLKAVPAFTFVIDKTALLKGSSCLERIVCKDEIIKPSAITGSLEC